MSDPMLLTIVGIAVRVAAVLVVVVARGRLRSRARVAVIAGSIICLGVAMWAGGRMSPPAVDHTMAMDRCVAVRADQYGHLSHGEALTQARADCERQLADDPDSFNWYWLT